MSVIAIAEEAAPVDDGAAKRLDSRIRLLAGTIRDNLHKIAELVEEAKRGQVHVALGFVSWPAYLADALGGQLELNTDARRSVVELLAGEGMSQRAIAQVVGVSEITVRRDKTQVRHDVAPECEVALPVGESGALPSVTGLDGKNYSGSRPNCEPRRRPLGDDARKLSLDLGRVNDKIRKLLEDDRFERNREVIINQLRPQIAIGLGLLQRLGAAGALSAPAGEP